MSMTVQDAMPGDLFIDKSGRVWKCYARCDQPTVYFHSLEGDAGGGPKVSQRMSGGIHGAMWDGFKLIRVGDT